MCVFYACGVCDVCRYNVEDVRCVCGISGYVWSVCVCACVYDVHGVCLCMRCVLCARHHV